MIKANDIKTTEDLQALLRDMTREMIDTIYEGELTGPTWDMNVMHKEVKRVAITGMVIRRSRLRATLGEIELSPPRDRLGHLIRR